MITVKNGTVFMIGSEMELSTEFAAIVVALHDKCDFPKETIMDIVRIGIETIYERKAEGKDIWEK